MRLVKKMANSGSVRLPQYFGPAVGGAENKTGTLLTEAGVRLNRHWLRTPGYSRELLSRNPNMSEGLRSQLRLSRAGLVQFSRLLTFSLQFLRSPMKAIGTGFVRFLDV